LLIDPPVRLSHFSAMLKILPFIPHGPLPFAYLYV
jgi:hypothetical protein